jgi:hypothetical protein
MVVWNLDQIYLGIFFSAVHMAVRLMVIDTQNLLAVRICTNPTLGRCP